MSATTYMLRKQASAASTNELSPPDGVRNLGVIFDSDFSFQKHVSNRPIGPIKVMLLHIHVLRRIQHHIPLSTAETISNSPRFHHHVPCLDSYAGFQLITELKFKLSTLTYRALAIHQPPYLASLLNFCNIPRQLRSSTSQQLSIPRTNNNNNNKQIYLQPHRVGFTYTVIYKQNKIQGNKMRRNVIRKVIHTATQRDTQSDTYFH